MALGWPWCTFRHSSRRKRLKLRTARTSACQSWIAFPLAWCILDAGRHFMPVLTRPNVSETWRLFTCFSIFSSSSFFFISSFLWETKEVKGNSSALFQERERGRHREKRASLRQGQAGELSIVLGDDAAQGNPLVESIVSHRGLPLGRQLVELRNDDTRYEVRACSSGHEMVMYVYIFE